MGSLISRLEHRRTVVLSGAAILGFHGLVLFLRRKPMITPSEKHVIFITGCDSGLGFSLALYAYGLGLTVIAGCLRPDGDGAKELEEKCPERLHVVQLDITDSHSVIAAVKMVQDLLEKHDLQLRALVNNAGIMIFGELEWLTEKHIANQINVNLLGTIRITKYMCSLLRKHSGRIITISSHCALATLPTLSVYGATKAGLSALCDGLRIELGKHGVPVITIIPGSFPSQSNILSRQIEYSREMEEEMSDEDFRYFGDYFMEFNEYLSKIPVPEKPLQLTDDRLYSKFKEAILAKYPEPHYMHEPFRYAWYHFLFKISPIRLRDYFIQKFMKLPKWQRKDS